MSNRTLHDVMSNMARQINGEGDFAHDYMGGYKDPADFVSALIMADPVYASLHKQFADADAQYKALVASNGEDDPMAEVARDKRDSAQSALETRRIECEADQDLMRKVLDLIPVTNEDQRILESRQQQLDYMREQAQLQTQNQKRQKALEDGEKGFYWAMWALVLLEQTLDATVRNFNLANAFSMACNAEHSLRRARA